tara:strand:- start:947 stop:1621 length:675 start_codon:yes stop_codon:yes gene_type:complete
MANQYFRKLPNVEYVNRTESTANLDDFIQVKNLFKKGKLRDDIFENLVFFDRYTIFGDDRPDNVAFDLYDDPTLDWVILLANNILNIYSEWPMSQQTFDEYLLEKYATYDNLYNGVHHYESMEIKDTSGNIIFPKGLKVDSVQSLNYYDYEISSNVSIPNLSVPVTNYEYEEKLNNDRRNIFVLKADYLPVVLDDMEEIMEYKKGSTQYVSETLQRADNIRLYT